MGAHRARTGRIDKDLHKSPISVVVGEYERRRDIMITIFWGGGGGGRRIEEGMGIGIGMGMDGGVI